MKISVTDLSTWVEAGTSLTGEKDTDFFMYSKKGRLYLAFIHPVMVYCKRLKAEGDITDMCINLPILRSMLKGKTGNIELTTTDKSLHLKGSGFKYKLDSLDKLAPTDVLAAFFSKKGDKTSFVNVTPKITKALKGIKDKITDTTLSVRLRGKGKAVQYLLSDSHHGIVITQKLEQKYQAGEMVLPIDTFFKVIGVAASTEEVTVEQTDSDITVQTISEFLSCRLKASGNTNITFDMVEGVVNLKQKGSCDIRTEELMRALDTCKSIVEHAPVKLSTKDSNLNIAMDTTFSKTSEKISAKVEGKGFNAALNVSFLTEVASAMFGECTLSVMSDDNILLSSQDDKINILGLCVSYVEQDDDD